MQLSNLFRALGDVNHSKEVTRLLSRGIKGYDPDWGRDEQRL